MNTLSDLLFYMDRQYPLWEPQDAVKLIYQRTMGCGHFLTDESESLSRLEAETRSLPSINHLFYEEIGKDWVRIYLSGSPADGVSLPLLNRMFFLSSHHPPGTTADLEAALGELTALAADGALSFSAEALDAYLAAYRLQGYPIVSHSETYRAAYRPAYRVLREEWLRIFPLFPPLNALLDSGQSVVLAIDGPAASGKTTLAHMLSRLYEAPVIAMDDFFLPPIKRTRERLAEPGGNIDYERFQDEVLPGLLTGQPFSYRIYDCSKQDFTSLRSVPSAPLRIVEGSYSHHPLWRSRFSLACFLTISPEEQKQRLLLRNGPEGASVFRRCWIPLENLYFEHFQIVSGADIIL